MSNKKTIIDVIIDYGLEPNKIGELYRAFCPFHDDTGKPNFTIWPKTNSWFCFACILGSSKVITPTGLQLVSNLIVGDTILGKHGEFKKITKITHKKVDNLVRFTLAQRNFPLIVTDDHKMMIFKKAARYKASSRTDYKKLQKKSLKECLAKDVVPGDFMSSPKLAIRNKSVWAIQKYFRSHNRTDGGGRTAKLIPGTIKLTKNVEWLIGIYIAEGSITSNGRNVCFTLNKRETDYAAKILYIIKDIFKLYGKLHVRERFNRLDVIVSNVYLVDFLKTVCGTKSYNKHIPHELFSLKISSLIRGLFDGDGHIYKNTQFFTTTSELLLWQVYFSCISLGKSPVITYKEAYTKNHVHHRESWVIQYSLSGKSINSRSLSDKYIFKVRKKEPLLKTHTVYDLSVDGGVFVVDGVLVHNCNEGGDIAKFISKFENISYKEAKDRVEGIVVELDELTENIDSIGLDDDSVIMNDQLNLLLSKTMREFLYKNPSKTKEALVVMQYVDNKLLVPINYNKMKKLLEEVTTKLQSFV